MGEYKQLRIPKKGFVGDALFILVFISFLVIGLFFLRYMMDQVFTGAEEKMTNVTSFSVSDIQEKTNRGFDTLLGGGILVVIVFMTILTMYLASQTVITPILAVIPLFMAPFIYVLFDIVSEIATEILSEGIFASYVAQYSGIVSFITELLPLTATSIYILILVILYSSNNR